jgi:NADH-quinone oxidoreductase subunit C
MDKEKLKEKILSLVPEAVFEENPKFPMFVIPAEKFRELALRIRNDEELAFDFLYCLSGVDWGKELGVTYHFASTRLNHELVLKAKTADRENPTLDTVADIWRTAEFAEREVYDLLGINFKGHPDMRRIFLEESWKGHPLRKDYTDEINIVEL